MVVVVLAMAFLVLFGVPEGVTSGLCTAVLLCRLVVLRWGVAKTSDGFEAAGLRGGGRASALCCVDVDGVAGDEEGDEVAG